MGTALLILLLAVSGSPAQEAVPERTGIEVGVGLTFTHTEVPPSCDDRHDDFVDTPLLHPTSLYGLSTEIARGRMAARLRFERATYLETEEGSELSTRATLLAGLDLVVRLGEAP